MPDYADPVLAVAMRAVGAALTHASTQPVRSAAHALIRAAEAFERLPCAITFAALLNAAEYACRCALTAQRASERARAAGKNEVRPRR